jgi:hypothetical protein
LNDHETLGCLAEIGKTQAFEAQEIWTALLRHSDVSYPEEAIREILAHLVAEGSEGIRSPMK